MYRHRDIIHQTEYLYYNDSMKNWTKVDPDTKVIAGVYRNDINMIQRGINEGATKLNYPLLKACALDNIDIEIIELLIKSGADVNGGPELKQWEREYYADKQAFKQENK